MVEITRKIASVQTIKLDSISYVHVVRINDYLLLTYVNKYLPNQNMEQVFLGFTGTFFSNSEWGSTQNVLMIVLHWSKQISRNCTHLLPNARSTQTVKIFFSLMKVYRFGVDPQ